MGTSLVGRTARLLAMVGGVLLFSGEGPSWANPGDDRAWVASRFVDDFVPGQDATFLTRLETIVEDLRRPSEKASAARRLGRMTHQHPQTLRRWLLGDQRATLGYERAFVLDLMFEGGDPVARALAEDVVLLRPALAYVMKALPDEAHAGRLRHLAHELGLIAELRAHAARMLMTSTSSTSQGQREGEVELWRLAKANGDVVRRFLLDESDGGLLDTYRAELVRAFLGKGAGPVLHELSREVLQRRARLATAVEELGGVPS